MKSYEPRPDISIRPRRSAIKMERTVSAGSVQNSGFDGEYWNIDAETSVVTRFVFTQKSRKLFVEAWGSCFPRDCEWGETPLFLVSNYPAYPAPSDEVCAFATWDADAEPSHCVFTLHHDELSVVHFKLGREVSYRTEMRFRKDPARSIEAQHADPLKKFQNMWDLTEPGWRLVEYDAPVYLVELKFRPSGPSRKMIPAIQSLVRSLAGMAPEKTWKLLRGCSGIGLGEPAGPATLQTIMKVSHQSKLDVRTHAIDTGDHLVLTPSGSYYSWFGILNYRRPVIERMLKAGCPVVSAHLE